MRSICSTRRRAAPQRARSASSPNGRLQRLTRKPGTVGGVDHAPCPSPRPVARATASAASPDCVAGDDLEQRHQRRRVEEVHARRRARVRRAAAAIAVTGSEEVLVASTQSSAHDLRQAREQLALELEPLGRRLDHELARARGPRARAPAPAAPRPPRASSASSARARRAFASPRADPLDAALERLGDRVVQQRARAGQARELGDPGAHRAGADDADGRRDRAALTPGRAR